MHFRTLRCRRFFADKSVTLMKGDWTNRDPAITQALAAFGRAGVPLYVVYNAKPGSTEPSGFAANPDRRRRAKCLRGRPPASD